MSDVEIYGHAVLMAAFFVGIIVFGVSLKKAVEESIASHDKSTVAKVLYSALAMYVSLVLLIVESARLLIDILNTGANS